MADSFTDFLALFDIRAFSRWFFLALDFFTPQVFLYSIAITAFCQYIITLKLSTLYIATNLKICVILYVTVFWKTDHLDTRTEIHLLPVRDSYTHALSRNTQHWTIDCQVCFYRRLFTDAVKPRGCISWCWGALIGLHGVPNCSSWQSGPPLWIVPVHVTY